MLAWGADCTSMEECKDKQCSAVESWVLPAMLIVFFDAYLNIALHRVGHFHLFHEDSDFFQQYKEIVMLIWSPDSTKVNPSEHLWDVLDQQVKSSEALTSQLTGVKGSAANILVPDATVHLRGSIGGHATSLTDKLVANEEEKHETLQNKQSQLINFSLTSHRAPLSGPFSFPFICFH